MRYISNKNGVHIFAPRVNEDTSTALDRISERMQCDFSYVGVTCEDDLRANGYKDLMDGVSIDWEKYGLIFVTVNN